MIVMVRKPEKLYIFQVAGLQNYDKSPGPIILELVKLKYHNDRGLH